MDETRCPGCGGTFHAIDGPTHAYMESSAGCWAVYGEVLAREYSDPALLVAHRLVVDAYAVQHPGRPSRRSIRSIAVHLIALHLVLEEGWSAPQTASALARAKMAGRLASLEPPESRGVLTVASVLPMATPDVHAKRVRAWAEAAWNAWGPHHDRIRGWAAAAQRERVDRASVVR